MGSVVKQYIEGKDSFFFIDPGNRFDSYLANILS